MGDGDEIHHLGMLLSQPTPQLVPLHQETRNPAEWMYERVVRSIKEFEERLDQQHEVGARLVSFGPDTTFHVEDVGYWGSDMLLFYGVDMSGRSVQLLQHVSQLSVLLVAVEKVNDVPRRIGFQMLARLDKDKE